LDNNEALKNKTVFAGVTLVFRNEPAREQGTSVCLVFMFLKIFGTDRDQSNTVTNLLGFVIMKQHIYCQGAPIIYVSFK
jgi:hypothetical protein